MSALGQKRTFSYVQPMSALLPKADMAGRWWGPEAGSHKLVTSRVLNSNRRGRIGAEIDSVGRKIDLRFLKIDTSGSPQAQFRKIAEGSHTMRTRVFKAPISHCDTEDI
jgi:hypothetical protein